MRKASRAIAALLLSAAGCQTTDTGYDRPARITNAGPDSRSALESALRAATGTNVTVADDALTNSSVLTIQQRAPRAMNSPPAQGRNMDVPLQFRLVINGRDCVLVDARDRSRYVLAGTRCEAEDRARAVRSEEAV